ncbi:MAG: cation:proton antiporter [Rickettsiales bacterium]|nr:cation:proton antiporter [Rickettsiales bacterium]
MKESPLLEVFMYASFFLAIAAIIIPLLKRLKVPAVLGYLCTGIIFGPQALGLLVEDYAFLRYFTLQNSDSIKLLSELGIVFLLFVIGLELTPKKLWNMRNLVFGLGAAQVTISSVIIGVIAYSWGNSVQASILLGLGLSLPSTAIITQFLHENKLFKTKPGQASFSILLFQDLAVIPILLLITIFTVETGDIGLTEYILGIVGKMIAAVLAIVLIGKYCLRPVFLFSNKYGGAESFIALSLLVIVVSASIAGMAGLSLALGAFIGGLLLAETNYSHEVSSTIIPFKSMLLGIFFISFGMSIDLHFITDRPVWLLLSAFGLMAIKFAIIFLLARLWKLPKSIAVESALLLPQAGEFGLLVVGSSITFGIMPNDVGQFMFLTIGITMILTPIINPMAHKFGSFIRSREENSDFPEEEYDEEISDHVIILGYGRMGQTISEILSKEGIKYMSFDNKTDPLRSGKNKNAPVYFGNVTKKSTLEAARIDQASCIIITIDQTDLVSVVYTNIRMINKDIPIIIRVRNRRDLGHLELYNSYIIPEYLSSSCLMAEKALEFNGFSNQESVNIVNSVEK